MTTERFDEGQQNPHSDTVPLSDLRADDSGVRLDALNGIDVETLSQDHVTVLAPELLRLLDDDHALVSTIARTKLLSIAEEYPREVGVRLGGAVTTLLELVDDPDTQTDVRETLIRTLGASGHPKVVRTLDRWYGNQHNPVQDAISDGLDAAVETTLQQLRRTDVSPESNTAQSLLFLAKHHPGRVRRHQKLFSELLEGENSDIIGDMFVELLKTPERTNLSMSILLRAVDIGPDASERRYQAAFNAIDAMARGSVNADDIAALVDRYRGWLASDELAARRRGLQLLIPIAEHTPVHLSGRLDLISELAVGDDEISPQATTLIKKYAIAKATTGTEYLEALLSATGGQAAITWLSETLEALRYESERGFVRPATGVIGGDTLDRLRRAHEDGRSLPLAWPSYTPEMTMTVTLELLFDGLAAGRDTVLFSRGTQSHWGYKQDLRDEFQRYAIQLPDAIDSGADPTPLDEVLPHAYVSGGVRKIDEGPESAPVQLILLDKAEQFEAIEGSSVGAIVFNAHSMISASEESLIDKVSEEFGEATLTPVYSLYTKNEFGERRVPRYGPPTNLGEVSTLPDVRALQRVAADDSTDRPELECDSNQTNSFPMHGDATFHALTQEREITVIPLDDDTIAPHLTEGYASVNELWEFDRDHTAARCFSYLQRFERLPIPPDRYDSWIRDRRRHTERGRMAYTTDEYIHKLEEFSEDVDMMGQIGLSDVRQELKFLLQELERGNALYDQICAIISEATAYPRDETIAIYTPTAPFRRALRDTLLEDGVLRNSHLRREDVVLYDSDTVRSMSHVDRLIVAGPQRRQQAAYLLHPNADRIEVLTYGGRWRRLIRRHAVGFADELNAVIQEEEYRPIPIPTVTIEGQVGPDPDETEAEGVVEHAGPDPDQQGAGAGLEERLAESIEDAGADDQYVNDRERYDIDVRRFTIETDDGTVLRRTSAEPVLVEERTVTSDGTSTSERYSWSSPVEIAEGDTIVVFDDSRWRALWNSWLEEQYEDVEGGLTVQLEIWYETLSAVLAETRQRLEREDDAIAEIAEQARGAGIERGKGTIKDWFQSVDAAGAPLDLASDSRLTIGPRNLEDIQGIGRAFDRPALQGEKGEQIDRSLGKIRGAHIREGHRLRDHLESVLNSGGEEATRLLDATNRNQIVAITEETG